MHDIGQTIKLPELPSVRHITDWTVVQALR